MKISLFHGRYNIRTRVETAVANVVSTSEMGYRSYLRRRYGVRVVSGHPLPIPMNTTLKSRQEVDDAVQLMSTMGFVPHPDPKKNWDAIGAIGGILAKTNSSAWILDAGGELYSPVLPCLYLCGYRNLVAVNLSFKRLHRRGPITYRPGDLLRTPFPDGTFDAISCLSVIEHGVDLCEYVREMARLLKPGGILITSTDFWSSPVETFGLMAYGAPIRVLCPQDIDTLVASAREFGLEKTGPIDMNCKEQVALWKADRLAFTYLTFTLRKLG